jgi:hypothetical protein
MKPPGQLSPGATSGAPPSKPAAWNKWLTQHGWVSVSSLSPTAVLTGGQAFLAPSTVQQEPDSPQDPYIVPPLTQTYPIASALAGWSSAPSNGQTEPPAAAEASVANGLQITDVDVQNCQIFMKVKGTENKDTQIALTSTSRPLPAVLTTVDHDTLLHLDLVPGAKTVLARQGNRVSAPVPVDASKCQATSTGNMSLVDGILTLPEDGGSIFLYIVPEGYKAIRVPVTPQATLKVGKVSNISAYLPNLPSTDKGHIEAWRQVGTEAVKIAEADLTSYFNESIGQGNASKLEMDLGNGTWGTIDTDDTTAQPKKFRWETSDTAIKHVLWQVLRFPLSPSNTELTPAGTLALGVAERNAATSTFTIQAADLDPTPAAGSPEANKPAANYGWAKGPTYQAAAKLVADAADADGKSLSDSPLPDVMNPDDVTDAELEQFLQSVSAGQNGRVYIRVIGLGADGSNSGYGPIGGASNLVAYDPPTEQVADSPQFRLQEASVSLGWRPNTDLQSCIRVASVPWTGRILSGGGKLTVAQPIGQELSAASLSEFYPVPGMYCPGDFGSVDPCDLACQADMFLDAAASVWDKIAAAYNGLIDGASTLMAEYNPICLGMTQFEAGEAAEACERIVKVAAAVGIAVVLEAYGLPPRLPTSGELVKIGEGKVEDIALAGLTSLGVPCEDMTVSGPAEDEARKLAAKNNITMPEEGKPVGVCEVLIHATITKVRAEAQAEMNKSIVQNTGLPNNPNIAGLTIIPEPRAWMPPAVVTVMVTVDESTIPEGTDPQSIQIHLPVVGSGNHYGSSAVVLDWRPASSDNPAQSLIEKLEESMFGSAVEYPERWSGVVAIPALRQDQIIYGTSETFTMPGSAWNIDGLPKVVGGSWPF